MNEYLNEKVYEDTPVLLVGMGGIGSEIVDMVYGTLKREGRADTVEVVTLDTDVNSQKKLKYIPDDRKIQTSTNNSVRYVLENFPSTRNWFQSKSHIEQMQLVNGAGQIREVSRLALYSAISEGKLKVFESVKQNLYKIGNNINKNGLRIMFVSSLMGGTGSGIFLQVPLYVRDIFENSQLFQHIDIQGSFILPDVLSGSLLPDMKDNVDANAYASMKELYAINKAINNSDKQNSANYVINLEYKPNQLDNTSGVVNTAVTHAPYDYCYFYDREDTNGNVLGSLKDYKKMISDNIYLQLVGRIGNCMYSNYINFERSIINSEGLNIFGGVGSGKLVYPYNDIVDFCVNKALSLSLDNQLLKLDNIYYSEYGKYSMDLLNGKAAKMPVLEDVYITNYESLTENDNFFKTLKNEMYLYDENENEISNNYDALKSKLDESMEGVYNDNVFQEQLLACKKGLDTFVQNPDATLTRNIKQKEDQLIDGRLLVESQAKKRAESRAVADFGVFSGKSEGNDTIFSEFLRNATDKKTFLNSVTIRYILYRLRKNLRNEYKELKDSMEDTRAKLIKKEDSDFVKLDGATKVSASVKSEEMLSNKGFLASRLKNFKTEYADKVRAHYKMLDNYCHDYIKMCYYDKVINLLDIMLDEYENMFRKLVDKRKIVEKTIDYLYHKHDSYKGTNHIYVYGNSECKNDIWENIPENIKNTILSKSLFEEMHKVIFANFQNKALNNKAYVSRYESLFDNVIFEKCRDSFINNEKVNEYIDFNIVKALIKENQRKGVISDNEYIKEKIIELRDTISPWSPKSQLSSDFSVWGYNRKCNDIESINLEKIIKESYGTVQNSIEVGNDVDDKEIEFIVVRYGLYVSDFIKFSAGRDNLADGDYYLAYKRLLERVTKGKEVTPHLDKNWDNLLPDFNIGVNKQKDRDISNALVYGIANKNFVVRKTNGEIETIKFVSEFGGDVAQINSKQNKPVDNQLKNLFDALQFNPDLVVRVNNEYETYSKKIEENTDIEKNVLDLDLIKSLNKISLLGYNDVKNILDVFARIYREYGNKITEDFTNRFDSLYEGLFEIVEKTVKAYCFGNSEELFKHKCVKVYEMLLEGSNYYNKQDPNSLEYREIFGKILNKIKDYK